MDRDFGNLLELPISLTYFLHNLLEWIILYLILHVRVCCKVVLCFVTTNLLGAIANRQVEETLEGSEKGSGWQGDNWRATANKERQMLPHQHHQSLASMALMPLMRTMSDGPLITRLCNKVTESWYDRGAEMGFLIWNSLWNSVYMVETWEILESRTEKHEQYTPSLVWLGRKGFTN